MGEGKTYDNSNDGAAWTCYGAQGFCQIGGVAWSWTLLWGEVKPDSKRPPARIILHQREPAEKWLEIPLWPPNREGAKESLSGKTETHFVNVYVRDVNEPKANERTPDVRVKFKPKQAAGQPASTAPRTFPPPQQRAAPPGSYAPQATQGPPARPPREPDPPPREPDPPPLDPEDPSFPF